MRHQSGKKRCFLSVLALCLLLSACGAAEMDAPAEVRADLRVNGGLSDTGYVLLENGAPRAVSEDELPALEEVSLAGTPGSSVKLSGGAVFAPSRITLGFDEGRRVSALYRDAAALGAETSLVYDAAVSSGPALSRRAERELLAWLEEEYGLSAQGRSAVSDGPFLAAADGAGDVSAVFAPRIYIVEGFITQDGADVPVQVRLPCVNILGCMDGLYSLGRG